jgi:hypothetical protein
MTEEIVDGSDIIYSIVPVKEFIIKLINSDMLCQPLPHEFAGYIVKDVDSICKFYSIEDNYKNPVLDHWTSRILRRSYTNDSWVLIKDHPSKVYMILNSIFNGYYIGHVDNFNIWKTDEKNGLIALVTKIVIDD